MVVIYFILGMLSLAMVSIVSFGIIFYKKIQQETRATLDSSQKILDTVNLRFQRVVKQVTVMDEYTTGIKEALKQDKYISLSEISNELDRLNKMVEQQGQILNVTQTSFNQFVDRILKEIYEVKKTGKKLEVPVINKKK